ncbi:hypothetical protein F5887DRAFT_934888 [Amanita rubescens]|nr:hypothetical protein F5887DRAFT_934888 [Amanita rubescens]
MIDMEIDFHSSLCCRSTTPNSMKRARSPELGPVDRPLKRPILVLSRPSSTEYLTFHPPKSSSDLVNTHPVDDWVSKAGYLSIDSPLMIAAISDSEHSNVNQDMSMDDSQDAYSNTKPLQTFPINIENAQSRLLESTPQGQLKDDTGYYAYQSPVPSPHSLYSKRSFSSDNASTFSAVSCASSTEGGYQISTAASPAVSAELRPPRKPRFTMGPRADCDLCRQGVKGHSAHWIS